jgi:DNA-binding transcriptional MerR regulator
MRRADDRRVPAENRGAVGLLQPSGATRRGNRLYSAADVERLQCILELRDLMGFDLERIRLLLQTEDRLAELKSKASRYHDIEHELDVEAGESSVPG